MQSNGYIFKTFSHINFLNKDCSFRLQLIFFFFLRNGLKPNLVIKYCFFPKNITIKILLYAVLFDN